MKQLKLILILVFFTLNAIGQCTHAFDDNDVRSGIKQQGGAEAFLKALSKRYAQNLPQQLDSETWLLSSLATGLQLNLTHRLVSIETTDDLDDPSAVNTFIKFQSNKLCSSPVSKILINEYGVTYRYQYLGNTGKTLFVFNVNKKNCLALNN